MTAMSLAEMLLGFDRDGGRLEINDGWWITWDGEGSDITLDGTFSIADLRALADHMARHSNADGGVR